MRIVAVTDFKPCSPGTLERSMKGVRWDMFLSGDWSYSSPLNRNRYGTLKQSNRNNQVALAFDFSQDPFHVAEGPMLDYHTLSHLEKRPRLHEEPRCHNRLKGANLSWINQRRSAPHADNVDYARCDQYGQSSVRIEVAKDVPRKQGKVNLLRPVRPASIACVQWQKFEEAFVPEDTSDPFFTPRFDLQGIPAAFRVSALHWFRNFEGRWQSHSPIEATRIRASYRSGSHSILADSVPRCDYY